MSAFGKRGGMGGGRPNFGVAKPMKGGPAAAAVSSSAPEPGGEQFPPLDDLTPAIDAPSAPKTASQRRRHGSPHRASERQR